MQCYRYAWLRATLDKATELLPATFNENAPYFKADLQQQWAKYNYFYTISEKLTSAWRGAQLPVGLPDSDIPLLQDKVQVTSSSQDFEDIWYHKQPGRSTITKEKNNNDYCILKGINKLCQPRWNYEKDYAVILPSPLLLN